MRARELVTLLDGQEVGRIFRNDRGTLKFEYADGWRLAPEAYPLSYAMPLAAREHGHKAIDAFLWGLLPDNDRIIDRWAREHHVGKNAFSLLACVGEDCAGAVQFAPPERLDALLDETTDEFERVTWLDERQVGARLRLLREDRSAWRMAGDVGQFSLAGAQPKTALLRWRGRWGIPSGRLPTTHILKPPIADLAGHVENEFLCLSLASALAMPSAEAAVESFDGEIAIVVRRYDRLVSNDSVVRVHQEDACQALSVAPAKKYESQGGPGARNIIDLLRDFSSKPLIDVRTFMLALGFNWIVGGTDAHAKNYSLLIAARGQVRLAPLYDVASILPYPHMYDARTLKLAMRIGSKYRMAEISRRDWMRLAEQVRVDPEQVVNDIRRMADELPDRLSTIAREALRTGLDRSRTDRLTRILVERAGECRTSLD